MKKNIWRLSTQPTVDEITTLLDKGVITKDEAKDMLFRNEEDIPKDQLKEIKDELKLLRELVLARISQKEVEIIHHHQHDYWPQQVWYNTPTIKPNWTYTYMSAATNNTSTSLPNISGTTINLSQKSIR